MQNHDCPINDAYVISKGTPVSEGYEAVELDNGYKFIFTRLANSLPIVRFKITEGKVCFNSKGFQTSPYRKLYPLIDYGKCNKRLRTRSIDPRYKQIAEIREDRLFKDNDILDVVSALPNFPVDDVSEYYWKLYANSYFYWSHFCESSPTTCKENFYEILEDIIDVKDNNNYILETSIFYALAICLLLQYFFCYFTLSVFKHHEDINKPMRTLFHACGYPVKIIVLMFLIYFCYTWIRTISQYQDIVISITVSEWSPDFTSQAFFAYEESLQVVYQITFRVCILACLSLVLVIMDLLWELSVRGVLQSTYGRLFDEYVSDN